MAIFTANEPLPILGSEELLDSPPPCISTVRAWAARAGATVPRAASRVQRFRLPSFEGFEYQDSVALMSRAMLAPDSPALWGVGTAEASLPAASPRVLHLQDDRPGLFTELLPVFGVRFSAYTPADYSALKHRTGTIVEKDSAFELLLVEHPDARPRLSLAKPRCVPDLAAALDLLGNASFRTGARAAVECGDLTLASVGDAPLEGVVRVEQDVPESLIVQVDPSEDAVLLINDAWQPGWTALLDGAPTHLLPANALVRAVPTPRGTHRVELRYHAPGLMPGVWLCAATCLGLAVTELLRRRRSPRKTG
ncbi:hypothetical protein D7X55_17040 [Corallococcus sp. AB049A]|nr:hypothetical protein D7X55_17040 [Corallococcus sp. AB049A]